MGRAGVRWRWWGGTAFVLVVGGVVWRLAPEKADAGVRPVATVEATGSLPVPEPVPPSPPAAAAEPAPRTATVTVPLRAPPRRPPAGEQLARTLGLEPPKGEDAVVKQLARFSPAELRLLAEVERRSGKPPSAALVAWVEKRRSGAAVQELAGQVDALSGGDLGVRAALLRWLAPPETPVPPAAPRPDGGVRPPLLRPSHR